MIGLPKTSELVTAADITKRSSIPTGTSMVSGSCGPKIFSALKIMVTTTNMYAAVSSALTRAFFVMFLFMTVSSVERVEACPLRLCGYTQLSKLFKQLLVILKKNTMNT